MLSCGTPNAYHYGFGSGGLFNLLYNKHLKNYEKNSVNYDIISIEICKRFDLAFSQALSILVTSFVNDVSNE